MKILIVTAWYHPFIHPRAHRWTAIAEHWAAEGHEIHVLTARHAGIENQSEQRGVHLHRTGFDSLKELAYHWFGSQRARGRVGVQPAKPGLAARCLAWLYKTVWKNIFFPDDACVWYFPARRKMLHLLKTEHFDAVISVSLPFSGHLLALRFRDRIPFWLADIGDPFAHSAAAPNNRFFYREKNMRLEWKVLECADAVTVTTEATQRKYKADFGVRATARMYVIPPLLHPIPSVQEEPSKPRTSRIKIGYFGAFYAPTRTPDAFLDLVARTFALRPDLRERLEIHFYGEIFPEFFEKISAQPAIQLHGLRSRKEVQRAMQQMDMLLNIGNTTDFQLPSKTVDYLASGKPVLNLSYVEHDPFVAFFQSSPLLQTIKIENGSASGKEFLRWLECLESEKPIRSPDQKSALVAPYTISVIGAQYLRLIRKKPSDER